MKPTPEDIQNALRILIEAKLKTLKINAEAKDDLFDSYIHHQIIQLYKDFPDLQASLTHGLSLFA